MSPPLLGDFPVGLCVTEHDRLLFSSSCVVVKLLEVSVNLSGGCAWC